MTELNITLSDIPDLTGRVAVVTGGARGIGRAIAQLLASKNAHVFIFGRSPPERSAPIPSNTTFCQCDIASWPSLVHAFRNVTELDLLFANAGIFPPEDLLRDDAPDADAEPPYPVLDTNLRGTLNTIKLGLAKIRRTPRPGSIVVVTSSTGYAPERGVPVFSAVKAAVGPARRGLGSTLGHWCRCMALSGV